MIPKEKIEKAAAVANDYTAIGYCTAFNDGFQCGVNFSETELQNIAVEFHIFAMKQGLIHEGEMKWTDSYEPKIREIAEAYISKFMAERGQG